MLVKSDVDKLCSQQNIQPEYAYRYILYNKTYRLKYLVRFKMSLALFINRFVFLARPPCTLIPEDTTLGSTLEGAATSQICPCDHKIKVARDFLLRDSD